MIGIYKITSPSNKIYIGQSIDIKTRWYKHRVSKSKTFLYNSFKKYGAGNHVFEVIEECDINLLNERERYWQDYYDVLNNGLNLKLTRTNDKSGYLSSDTKIKISKRKRTIEEIEKSKISRTGLKRTEEQRQRIKNGRNYSPMKDCIKAKISEANKGKNPSIEARLKMSIAKTKRSIKTILDTNTGIFYFGCKEASIAFGYSESHINRMLLGTRNNKTNLIYV